MVFSLKQQENGALDPTPLLFVILEFELRTLCLESKHTPPVHFALVIFGDGVSETFFPWLAFFFSS
jgi:hypothetical protein